MNCLDRKKVKKKKDQTRRMVEDKLSHLISIFLKALRASGLTTSLPDLGLGATTSFTHLTEIGGPTQTNLFHAQKLMVDLEQAVCPGLKAVTRTKLLFLL